MTHILSITKYVAGQIEALTGIATFTETDMETREGAFDDALLLSISTSQEVIQNNNTQRIHYTLGFVVQPETLGAEEQAAKLQSVYDKLTEYLASLPQYAELSGGIFLDFSTPAWSTSYDAQAVTYLLTFSLVVQL